MPIKESARARARREAREREAEASAARRKRREAEKLNVAAAKTYSTDGPSGFTQAKSPKDEKRIRLLNDIDKVKNIMTENLEKGLANYEVAGELEAKSENLLSQAKTFERRAAHNATRAFWDHAARKVYISAAGLFGILLVLMLIFHWVNICEVPENYVKGRQRLNGTAISAYDEEPDPHEREGFWAWECPTMWMGMLMVVDVIAVLCFWQRRKFCCCWCRGCPMLGCM